MLQGIETTQSQRPNFFTSGGGHSGMFVRTCGRRTAARWPAALTKVHGSKFNNARVSSSSAPTHFTWVLQWSHFFHFLQDSSSSELQSFELVPISLLRSIGQHWVDQLLATAVADCVAQVYPRAQPSATSHRELHTSKFELEREAAASLEALVALWSAHVLLATLYERSAFRSASDISSGQPATASAKATRSALAASLHTDVLPVVSYLTQFSRVNTGLAPVSGVDVVHRALVLVLSSFWSAWKSVDERDATVLTAGCALDAAPSAVSAAEAALARELLRCIDILHCTEEAADGGARGALVDHDTVSQSSAEDCCTSLTNNTTGPQKVGDDLIADPVRRQLRAETKARLTQLRVAVATLCGTDATSGCASPKSHSREAAEKGIDDGAEDDELLNTLRTWMHDVAGQKHAHEMCDGGHGKGALKGRRYAPDSSPFAGITGVSPAAEESEDVLARINEALNQVALSSAGAP